MADRLSFEQIVFAATHLVRTEEAAGAQDAWDALLRRRFDIFVSLTDFDQVPIGWLRAAVRLFDVRAADALRRVVDRRDWPGDDEAERAMLAAEREPQP